MKKFLAGLTAIVLALGIVAVTALPADAHTPKLTTTCSSLTVDLKFYATSTTKTNTVTVWIDDVVHTDTAFQASYKAAYSFSDATSVHTWRVKVFALDNSVYSFDTSGSSTPCLEAVPPTFTPPACSAPGASTSGSYAIPTTPGVKYQVKLDSGSFVDAVAGVYVVANGISMQIKAVALAGYALSGASDWGPVTFESVGSCVVTAIATAPTITDSVCTGAGTHGTGSFTIPATTGVQYQVRVDGGSYGDVGAGTTTVPIGTIVEIRAQPLVGYTLSGPTSWAAHKFVSPGACLIGVAETNPSFTDSSCVAPGEPTAATYTIVGNDHINYFASINSGPQFLTGGGVHPIIAGSTITVVAVAEIGYVIDPVDAGPWSHRYRPFDDCVVEVIPVVAAVVDQGCDKQQIALISGSIAIAVTEHVAYFIDGVAAAAGLHNLAPGDYVVTAEAASGYSLAQYPSEGWPVSIEPVGICGDLGTLPLVVPLASMTQLGCKTTGSFTLANDLATAGAVAWTVNGAPSAQGTFVVREGGRVVVSAVPVAPGFGFAVETLAKWSFVFAPPLNCDLDTLALTGTAAATGLLGASSILLVLGGVLVTSDRRMRMRAKRS